MRGGDEKRRRGEERRGDKRRVEEAPCLVRVTWSQHVEGNYAVLNKGF